MMMLRECVDERDGGCRWKMIEDERKARKQEHGRIKIGSRKREERKSVK